MISTLVTNADYDQYWNLWFPCMPELDSTLYEPGNKIKSLQHTQASLVLKASRILPKHFCIEAIPPASPSPRQLLTSSPRAGVTRQLHNQKTMISV